MSRTRILFVDDDVNVLDGLRRLLRRHRDEWDTVFASNGAEALAQLAAAPFDVLVTDMQMPGISGGELLQTVTDKYPCVARIILSGQTDEAGAARVVNITHQFLSKPVDAEALRRAVQRACAARQSLPDQRLRSIVASVGTLPSPPEAYLEISRTVASEGSDARQIASIVSRDPALAAKLLQLVNTSFFGVARRVSSVEHAVTLLGLARLKSLVLTAHILDQYRPVSLIPGFSVKRLMARSVLTAHVARLICQAEQQGVDRPDQAYAAGLLHDVGLLVLATWQADGLAGALRRAAEEQIPICVAEQEVLGAAHPDVGAYLLELWSLPPRIVEGVRLHHRPIDTEFAGFSALSAVHVAAALSHELEPSSPEHEEDACYAPELDLAYLTRIGRAARVEHWKAVVASALSEASAEVV